LEAQFDIALVDYLGGLAEERQTRCDNPVLIIKRQVVEAVG
jgi:hypothetical protein